MATPPSLPAHESCVENFLFSGVLCPCPPHHICVHTAMYVLCALHIFYVLACPASVLPCHVPRNLSAHTASRVFLGEYSFGRFPICSQEETRRMALLVSAKFIPAGRLSSAVQCVVVGVFFQGGGAAFLRPLGTTSPFGSEAGAKTPHLWLRLALYTRQAPSQCTQALLSTAWDPDQ